MVGNVWLVLDEICSISRGALYPVSQRERTGMNFINRHGEKSTLLVLYLQSNVLMNLISKEGNFQEDHDLIST